MTAAKKSFVDQRQGGQGVSGPVSLEVEVGGEPPLSPCEIVAQAVRSREVADAINQADFGLYFLGKPERIAELTKAHYEEWFPGLVADDGEKSRAVTPCIDGVLFRDGRYFLVDRQRVYPLDSFGMFHGDPLQYVARFLLQVFRIVQPAHCPGAAGGCNVPEGECIGACQP